MTDSQQKCFLAVAEHHSFSKAADALYVSQPAVSKSINALEAELETTLFDRQGKYITLTQAGEIFRSFLISYQREHAAMRERIKALDRGKHSGIIRIGCDMTWNAAHFYTRISRHFSIHFPNVQLEVEGLSPENFLPSLRRRDVDLVIMYRRDLEHQHDIESVPLADIHEGFIVSSLLGAGGSRAPEALVNVPFLYTNDPADRHSNEMYRSVIEGICQKYGFSPQMKSCKNFATAHLEVSCGRGALLVDEWSSAKNNPEYTYIGCDSAVPVCMAHLPTAADSLLRLFLNEAQKVFSNNL